ncbi:response regulator [Carnobacterium gallinarum]|uniref:response regulator n=1 Tax=Carnobacterium gallinarum TaxID=2749 RepID=UPI00054DCFBC|nr:response regulator [Carnobacterium gallinarum]
MTKVLIIEDDPMVATLNQQFIQKIAEVEIIGNVRNIQDARALLAKESVDLLLLDVYLPGMTGLEFLAELHEKKMKVAVILITAANDVSTVKEAIYYGVVDYLIKPFTFERFKLAFEKFQELTNVTQEIQATDQSQLDKYFNSSRLINEEVPEFKNQEELPKGLSRFTLKKIYYQIKQHQSSFSTEELAGEVGLSRISTKKYLVFLAEIQVLEEEMEYLEIGRPLTLYRLNQAKTNDVHRYINE